MTQIDAIKSAVKAVLESQTSQTTYPYLLIPKVMIAIDDAAAQNPKMADAITVPIVAKVSVEIAKEKKVNPGLAKAQAAAAAKRAAKKAEAAAMVPTAASIEEKAETEPEVKAAEEIPA